MKTQHGEPSFHLGNDALDLHITARGGHLAPVVFHLPGRDVSPYSLSPWLPDQHPDLPPLLSVLRGDFLCLPFGPQENGPPHGDTANAEWSLVRQDEQSLHLALRAADTGARVDKILTILPGGTAIYCEHRISGLEGDFNFGNHPVLDLSGLPDGGGRVSVSPFRYASVYPGWFSNQENGETQALEPGARFTDLREVPLIAGGSTDLTRYPARPGNDDLVMMVSVPASEAQPFAWSAVVMDGYVWFSLKNPADFPATLFWISNGGRSRSPWNGRHVGRIGVEEVCSHFCDGVDLSSRDLLAAEGIPTARRFQADEMVSLRTVQAVVAVPEGFGMVESIKPDGAGRVLLTDESGSSVGMDLNWRFPNPENP